MKEIKIASEDLSSIVSHYRAVPILIAFVKAHGGEACLQKWDKERNKKLIIGSIIYKAGVLSICM